MGILPLLYGVGYLAQFLKNYKIWSAAGGVAGDGTAPQFPDCRDTFLFSSCIFNGWLLCFAFRMHLDHHSGGDGDAYGKQYRRRIRQRTQLAYSEKGTYGTAGYLEQKEMKKLLCLTDIRHTKGTILGIVEKQIASIPLESRMNRNIAVYGASGSMKSRAFVRNMIFQCVRVGKAWC